MRDFSNRIAMAWPPRPQRACSSISATAIAIALARDHRAVKKAPVGDTDGMGFACDANMRFLLAGGPENALRY